MDEKEIKKIVKDEISRKNTGVPTIQRHLHDDVDSPKISQSNITPGTRLNGTITMSQNTVYTLPTIGVPTSVKFYGGALNVSSGIHAIVIGDAEIGGTNRQFQPGTSTSVTLNNVNEGIMQGSAGLITFNSTGHSVICNSQDHIILVEDVSGPTIYAIADIISYGQSGLKIQVSGLAMGWSISGLWIIT